MRRRAHWAATMLLAGLSACSRPGAPDPLDETGRASSAPIAAPSPGYALEPRQVRSEQTGLASWYGEAFQGRLTASGEIFDQHALTAAHRSLPLRSLARVTRLDTGQSVLVRINDRGPFVEGRIIDLSRAAAEDLGFIDDGLARVRVESLGPADPQDRAARSRILRRD